MPFVKVGGKSVNLDDVRYVEIEPESKKYPIQIVWKGTDGRTLWPVKVEDAAELCRAVGLEAEYQALVDECSSDR